MAGTSPPRGRALLRWLLVLAFVSVPGTPDVRGQPSSAPETAWQPIGARITWRGVSFIVPPGMTGTDRGAFYDMVGLGMRGRGGQCSIVIFAETPSGGDLPTLARDLLVRTLAELRAGVADSRGGSDLIGERRVGRSAEGWRYVELNGMLTPGGGGRARIMLIDRGAMATPIIAISQPANGCVGLSIETTPNDNTITWAALYYSLKLPGVTPSNHLREQIVGRWESFGMSKESGQGGLRNEVYATNGRYGSASAGATVTGLPSYSGDGSYSVKADLLEIFPNAGRSEAHRIRIVEDFSATTPAKSNVRLCKVKVYNPVGPFEQCLNRVAN